MRGDPGGGEQTTAATRAAVLEHVAAFNAHDTARLLAGLHPDVVWVTGVDVFRGPLQLRNELLDEGLWEMRPSLTARTLVVEGGTAAGTFHEVLTVGGEVRQFDIAVFFTVRDALIRNVQVFREGTAGIEP